MKRYVFLVMMATLFVGCGDGDGPTAPSVNVPFSATELRAGTGREAVAGKGVTVQYAGWLYDPNQPNNKGSLFDTSVNRGPYSFVLGVGAVIRGWDQGLVGLKVGGGPPARHPTRPRLRRRGERADSAECHAAVRGGTAGRGRLRSSPD